MLNCQSAAYVVPILLFVGNALAADAPAPVSQELVIGDNYTIAATRQGVKSQFSGSLVKVTDRWIVLRFMVAGRNDRNIPFLSKLPLAGRAFTIAAVAPKDDYLWIPRDAATVVARTPAANQAHVHPPATNAPPMHIACSVQFAQNNKLVQREGGMEVVSDDHVTLSVPKMVSAPSPSGGFLPIELDTTKTKRKERRYTREQLACQDILCVRVANFVVDEHDHSGHAH